MLYLKHKDVMSSVVTLAVNIILGVVGQLVRMLTERLLIDWLLLEIMLLSRP
jgi:hypothetical protein